MSEDITFPVTTPKCRYQEACSGCQLLEIPYKEQNKSKVEDLKSHLSKQGIVFQEIDFLSAGEFFLRDRLDFTLIAGRLGLFAQNQLKDHLKNPHEIIDIEECLQLSPALQEWLTEFRKICWPMEKASFRLRVSPQGKQGVWIDCANIDIKNLLSETKILRALQKIAFVEIGQKRKVPYETSAGYKLQDPVIQVWFQTWMQNKVIPLFCNVASFTQPSLKANKIIAEMISGWIQRMARPRLLEFGSGIGNLTLPALVHAESLTACEIDKLSLEGLRRTLKEQNLLAKVEIHAGDFQKKLSQDFSHYDLILCNPPRSGLLNFLSPLESLTAKQRPRFFIYMSCYPESLSADLARLQKQNYQIQKIVIVDQFPQTKHYEVLCLLEQK